MFPGNLSYQRLGMNVFVRVYDPFINRFQVQAPAYILIGTAEVILNQFTLYATKSNMLLFPTDFHFGMSISSYKELSLRTSIDHRVGICIHQISSADEECRLRDLFPDHCGQ